MWPHSNGVSYRDVLLASFFCLVFLQQDACSAPSERVARFFKGSVTTKAKLGSEGSSNGRLLQDRPEDVTQAFLVGYDAAEEDAVAAELGKNKGIIIMQPIPDDHWIVKAKPSEIEALQATFPSVTVALLPSNVKASEGVDMLLNSLQQIGVASSSTGSAPSAWLDTIPGLELHKTSDGRTQVAISLQATPFASMGAVARGEVNLDAVSAEARAWAADLAKGLAAQLQLPSSDPCAPSAEAAWIFGAATVRVCASHAPLAADWLLAQPSMVWVDLQRGVALKDMHVNIAIQDGPLLAPLTGRARDHLDLTKYWAKGLTGKDQVSGVTDTGIDMDACHFWDPSFRDYQTNNVQRTSGDRLEFRQFKSSQHRKVDAYFFHGNSVDDTMHGTHVASTLAGSAWNPRSNQPFDPLQNPDYATGIAPEARLSFFDIESRENATNGVLDLPPGIEMFHAMYQQGVRVISNSWGGDTGNYNSMCTLFDAYTWFLQDLMLLAAAGNEGLRGTDLDGITREDLRKGTMASPGSCKNIMSVGAAENWSGPSGPRNAIRLLDNQGNQVNPPSNFFRSMAEREGRSENFAVEFKVSNAEGIERGKLLLRLGDGITRWPSQANLQSLEGQELEVVRAGNPPSDACTALDSSNFEAGRMLVFTHSSDCSQQEQGNNVINNGNEPAGGILVDENSALDGAPSVSLTDNTKVFGYIRGSNRLLELLDRENSTTRMKVFKISPQENIASFSSFGALAFSDREVRETQDLRTQPTVVAPGYALSSNGNGYNGQMDRCEVATLSGSSMATPAVGGMATLIRQYFMDGYYPTGDRVSDNGFEPTAALLQAVIVGSSEAMIGDRAGRQDSDNSATSGPLQGLPSQGRFIGQHTGWGRASLRGLKLNGDGFDPNWGLQVIQKASHNSERRKHVYTIQANGKGPLIVTLVYMDYPTNPNVRPLLVNDLDLKVTSPSGADETQEFWGNDVRGGDGLNNIERVTIEYPDAGEYTIEVHSRRLFREARPQPYALAIMGGIEGEVDSPFNPARLTPATQPEDKLTRDSRTLRVRFVVDDQEQALQVVSNTSHLEFETRTLSAFQSRVDSEIVGSITLRSASIEASTDSKRRQLRQTTGLLAEFEFGAANEGAVERLTGHISEDVIPGFPLRDSDAADSYFGNGFSADFSVTSVEGSVMPAMDLGFVYMPPPPGRAQVPTSHALGLHVGLAALLGCALLRLMLVLP